MKKLNSLKERFDNQFTEVILDQEVRTVAEGIKLFIEQEIKKERELKDQEHKAELQRIKGEIEKFETYDDEPDNCRRLKIETLFILDRHINSLTTE